jgi:P-type conjugative transfer protein TrbJ
MKSPYPDNQRPPEHGSLAYRDTSSRIADSRLKHFAAMAVLVLLSLAPLHRASAQLFGGVVFDPSNFARNVLHYARRLEQMELQKTQLQQQLVAMQKLTSPPWRDISQTVAQLDALMADSRALAYQLGNLNQQFKATFPVDRSFKDWPAERRAQALRTVATMETVLSSARAQAGGFTDGLGRIAQIKARVGTIQGHEAALELQNTATVFGAEELMLLRQALMAQTSMQAVYYADRVNTDAQQAATIDERLTALSVPARRSSPIYLRVGP